MFTPKVARGNPGAQVIRVSAERWRNKSPNVSPLADKNWHGQAIQTLPQEECDDYDNEAVDTPPPPARQTKLYVIARSHGLGLELSVLECVSPEFDSKLLAQAQSQGWTVLHWAYHGMPPFCIHGPVDEDTFRELVARNTPILATPFRGALAKRRLLAAEMILDRHPLSY